MARLIKRRLNEHGVAILETSAIMITIVGILLSGWAAIDLFQRGIALGELVKSTYYDGVVSGYQISDDKNSVNINRAGLSQFVETKINELSTQIESQNISSSRYQLQGALIEVVWKRDAEPIIERITRVPVRGGLAIPISLTSSVDMTQLAEEYLNRLIREGTSRESLLRPDLWQGTTGQLSTITDSFVLLGVSAALSVDDGLAKLLLEGAGEEAILIRSSFNSLRRDL
jgi:hypothetical protein